MQARAQKVAIYLAIIVIFLGLSGPPVSAKITTAAQAQWVVQSWLSLSPAPLETPMGAEVLKVQTFRNKSGQPVYHVVSLKPAGLVLVPADDLVEPIVGFSPENGFDPSPANPLGALASRDLTGRVESARQAEALALAQGKSVPPEEFAAAQRKWALLERGPEELAAAPPVTTINDPRVDPLLLVKPNSYYAWWQIPLYAAPIKQNVPAGCVAVAMAQLMRFHRYPSWSVWNPAARFIYINNVTYSPELPEVYYNWAAMPLTIPTDPHNSSRLNIYRILHDAGMSVHMNYTPKASGIPGPSIMRVANALTGHFKYGTARCGYNAEANLPSVNRNLMINPNLDAGLPVLLGIVGLKGGHEVVGDGYGYNLTTLYHHLNLGWGNQVANIWWYNLPSVPPPGTTISFTSVTNCIYNIFPLGTGEIISGRVVDATRKPIPGATVTATVGTSKRTVATNPRGIFAFSKLPANTSFVVKAAKLNYQFPPAVTIKTGTSINQTMTTGNRLVNFQALL